MEEAFAEGEGVGVLLRGAAGFGEGSARVRRCTTAVAGGGCPAPVIAAPPACICDRVDQPQF